MGLVLYELMELEYPRSFNLYEQMSEAKAGTVKRLKSKRKQSLIDLYKSMQNLV
jgi:hypothetical protein